MQALPSPTRQRSRCARLLSIGIAFTLFPAILWAADPSEAKALSRYPLRELYTSQFPFDREAAGKTKEDWEKRRQEIRQRILLACGLLPMPTKTPLNAVIHGRIERDDYTIDRVFFESFPGHYVTGNLYLPKNPPADGKKMPGILCPHGHWPDGRFMDLGVDTPATKHELAIGAERWESGARSPLQARCVQLARMGCAVFFYDMLGYADSVQIPDHRSGRRPDLDGTTPGTYGLYSAAADLRLQSNFGLQIWNGLRGLDFLLSLPGVDPSRIACTGASGGGTQTMMLAAIDDRLAAVFPCVMVSTAMQGGCTCENANYLRIGQGNVDIAAAFAPKPMGMTAADDWTKELESKGYPDLKVLWARLGQPNNVMATFNIHWKHNYNHVSRTSMYGFMSQHLAMGYKEPVLERSYTVSTPQELTVWTDTHPKPTGDQVGGTHEKALLQHWSTDSDTLIQTHPEIAHQAWKLILNRPLPEKYQTEIVRTVPDSNDATSEDFEVTYWHARYVKDGDFTPVKTITADELNTDRIPPSIQAISFTIYQTNKSTQQATKPTILWMTQSVPQEPDAAMRKALAAGHTIIIPRLIGAGLTQNPWNPVKSRTPDPERLGWQWSSCYTYGYNDPLLVKQAQEVLTFLSALHQHSDKISSPGMILAATDGMAPVAALAASQAHPLLTRCVIDTAGFRFSTLKDVQDARFLPGAVKYGDLPGILKLIAPEKLTLLGEPGTPVGGTAALWAEITR